MYGAPGTASKTAAGHPQHCFSVILGKIFKILTDFFLADFVLKWTVHIHKIHPSISTVKCSAMMHHGARTYFKCSS